VEDQAQLRFVGWRYVLAVSAVLELCSGLKRSVSRARASHRRAIARFPQIIAFKGQGSTGRTGRTGWTGGTGRTGGTCKTGGTGVNCSAWLRDEPFVNLRDAGRINAPAARGSAFRKLL